MFDLLGVGAINKRVEDAENLLRQTLDKSQQEHLHFSRWIAHLHHENRMLKQQFDYRPVLTEQQVVTLVEKHAAFDVILQRIRGIEQKVESISDVPRIEDMQHRIEQHVELAIAQKVDRKIEVAVAARGEVMRQDMLGELRQIAARVDHLEERPVPERIERIERIVEQAPQQVTGNSSEFTKLQQRLLKRISKHPKNVVKSAILTLIQKYARIQGTELRDMVEEQQLCSKSSFYRLLEELEQDGMIEVLGDGKEKTYADAILKNKV